MTYAQLLARITPGFMHKNRIRMFDNMQKLPVKYFDATNHGDIMSYYTNDIGHAAPDDFPESAAALLRRH